MFFLEKEMAEEEQSMKNQMIILQQPNGEKIYFDLNLSTDTTAITSFALSVMIALILGGLATWLAYWYGRKSFNLTEMSFRTVSEDIQQAAEIHRNTTREIIISSQKEREARFIQESKKNWELQVTRCLIEYDSLISRLISDFNNLRALLKHEVEQRGFINKNQELLTEFNLLLKRIQDIEYRHGQLKILIKLHYRNTTVIEIDMLGIPPLMYVNYEKLLEFDLSENYSKQLFSEYHQFKENVLKFLSDSIWKE